MSADESKESEYLQGAIEAMLFVSDEPVGIALISEMTGSTPSQVLDALHALQAALASGHRGVELREVAGGWRLFTNPAYFELLEKYVLSWDTRKLSQAALEVLAIIAYSQPVTRAGVAAIRGVNSDSSINSLVEKGLVREAGTSDAPGNPMLYATTRAFLERFGLASIADLPALELFAPDEETRELIRKRLGATSIDDGSYAPDGDEYDGLVFESDGDILGQQPSGKDDVPAASPTDAGSIFSQDAMRDLLAATAGVVEKIDFDSLVFEADDE